MGSGGEAGHADIPDDLSLFNVVTTAGSTRISGQVGVHSAVIATVLDDYAFSITTVGASEGDLAVTRGFDRGARRGRIINTLMGADAIQDRVFPPQAET